MTDAPNLCPTCRTVITPKEAKEYQALQARIAELEALSNGLCDWLEGYGADLRKEPEIYRLLGREL